MPRGISIIPFDKINFHLDRSLFVPKIGFSDFLDILFMTLIIYSLFVWLKRTRAVFVLMGILILGAIYLLARQFNLYLTTAVFQGFFAIILVAVVIIFQEELRHFLEEVAVWILNRRLVRSKPARLSRPEVEILVRTLVDLAREKIGALIVIRGKSMLARYLEGGVELDGKLSEPLFKSLFDPNSIGHDGAVVIEGDRIARFSCYLPLSKDISKLQNHGTRHAAALGLSELTDALCLAVSEEKGTISAASGGNLRKMESPEKLNAILEQFYQEISPRQTGSLWQDFFKKNSAWKILAFALAAVLWFIFVWSSKQIYQSYRVPVQTTDVPPHLQVASIEPRAVSVTLRGQRRHFYFEGPDSVKLFLRNWNMKKGAASVAIAPSDLDLPKNLSVINVYPKNLRVQVEKKNKPAQEFGLREIKQETARG